MPFNEHGYIPTMPLNTRFLSPQSVPPDIGQRNPWLISMQPSSHRQIMSPNIICHPSPVILHQNPMLTISLHLSVAENQSIHVPPSLALALHGGVPGYGIN